MKVNMPQPNFLRMIQLAEEFFETKNDPEQLSIDEHILERLYKIHPATMGERKTDDGPVTWTIVIPTTNDAMNKFLRKTFSERELFEHTSPGEMFDSVYLCSALVLPEYRGKGLAKELTCQSIRAIQKDHPISHLYYWEFSEEGKRLAQAVAGETGIALKERM